MGKNARDRAAARGLVFVSVLCLSVASKEKVPTLHRNVIAISRSWHRHSVWRARVILRRHSPRVLQVLSLSLSLSLFIFSLPVLLLTYIPHVLCSTSLNSFPPPLSRESVPRDCARRGVLYGPKQGTNRSRGIRACMYIISNTLHRQVCTQTLQPAQSGTNWPVYD